MIPDVKQCRNAGLISSFCRVCVRRLHDTDHSGWWSLISITVIGIIPLHLACKYGRSHAEQIRQSDLKINQRQAQASFAARLGMQPKEGVCLKNFLVINLLF